MSQLLNNLPIRVGPEAGLGIILQEDTFIELGNPAAGSFNFLVTFGKEGLEQLNNIAFQVEKITREIQKKTWAMKGIDIDCSLDWDSRMRPLYF